MVNCESQQEMDELWEKLTAGGERNPMRMAERQVWFVRGKIVPTILGRIDGRTKIPKKASSGDAGNDADDTKLTSTNAAGIRSKSNRSESRRERARVREFVSQSRDTNVAMMAFEKLD